MSIKNELQQVFPVEAHFLFGPTQLQLYQVKGLLGGRGVSGPKGGIF